MFLLKVERAQADGDVRSLLFSLATPISLQSSAQSLPRPLLLLGYAFISLDLSVYLVEFLSRWLDFSFDCDVLFKDYAFGVLGLIEKYDFLVILGSGVWIVSTVLLCLYLYISISLSFSGWSL